MQLSKELEIKLLEFNENNYFIFKNIKEQKISKENALNHLLSLYKNNRIFRNLFNGELTRGFLIELIDYFSNNFNNPNNTNPNNTNSNINNSNNYLNNNKFSKILEELKKLPVISNLVKLTHFESDLSPTIIVMEDIHHGRDFSKKSNYLSDLKKLELLRQKLGITLLGIEGLLNNYSNIKKMKDMIIGGEDWLIYTLLTSYKNKYELIGLENPNNIIKEIPPIYSEEFIVNIMEKREQFATEIFLQEIKKKEKSIGILFYGKAHIDIYSRIVDIVRTEKQRIWLKKEVDRMIESQEISSDVGIVALLKLKGERIFGRKPNIIIIKIDDDAN